MKDFLSLRKNHDKGKTKPIHDSFSGDDDPMGRHHSAIHRQVIFSLLEDLLAQDDAPIDELFSMVQSAKEKREKRQKAGDAEIHNSFHVDSRTDSLSSSEFSTKPEFLKETASLVESAIRLDEYKACIAKYNLSPQKRVMPLKGLASILSKRFGPIPTSLPTGILESPTPERKVNRPLDSCPSPRLSATPVQHRSSLSNRSTLEWTPPPTGSVRDGRKFLPSSEDNSLGHLLQESKKTVLARDDTSKTTECCSISPNTSPAGSKIGTTETISSHSPKEEDITLSGSHRLRMHASSLSYRSPIVTQSPFSRVHRPNGEVVQSDTSLMQSLSLVPLQARGSEIAPDGFPVQVSQRVSTETSYRFHQANQIKEDAINRHSSRNVPRDSRSVCSSSTSRANPSTSLVRDELRETAGSGHAMKSLGSHLNRPTIAIDEHALSSARSTMTFKKATAVVLSDDRSYSTEIVDSERMLNTSITKPRSKPRSPSRLRSRSVSPQKNSSRQDDPQMIPVRALTPQTRRLPTVMTQVVSAPDVAGDAVVSANKVDLPQISSRSRERRGSSRRSELGSSKHRSPSRSKQPGKTSPRRSSRSQQLGTSEHEKISHQHTGSDHQKRSKQLTGSDHQKRSKQLTTSSHRKSSHSRSYKPHDKKQNEVHSKGRDLTEREPSLNRSPRRAGSKASSDVKISGAALSRSKHGSDASSSLETSSGVIKNPTRNIKPVSDAGLKSGRKSPGKSRSDESVPVKKLDILLKVNAVPQKKSGSVSISDSTGAPSRGVVRRSSSCNDLETMADSIKERLPPNRDDVARVSTKPPFSRSAGLIMEPKSTHTVKKAHEKGSVNDNVESCFGSFRIGSFRAKRNEGNSSSMRTGTREVSNSITKGQDSFAVCHWDDSVASFFDENSVSDGGPVRRSKSDCKLLDAIGHDVIGFSVAKLESSRVLSSYSFPLDPDTNNPDRRKLLTKSKSCRGQIQTYPDMMVHTRPGQSWGDIFARFKMETA